MKSLLGCSICANSESLADGVAAGAFWTAFWGILGIGGAIIACIPVLAGLTLANGRGWAKIATIVFAVLIHGLRVSPRHDLRRLRLLGHPR